MALKISPGRWGKTTPKERVGREGLWLEGRLFQLQWGDGGTLQRSSHFLGALEKWS